MRQIGDEILDDRHVRQWIDTHWAVDILNRLDASQRIGSVDVHCARAAYALAARTAERQCCVDLFLILISASRTIGPQSLRSISKVSTAGFLPSSGFHR